MLQSDAEETGIKAEQHGMSNEQESSIDVKNLLEMVNATSAAVSTQLHLHQQGSPAH